MKRKTFIIVIIALLMQLPSIGQNAFIINGSSELVPMIMPVFRDVSSGNIPQSPAHGIKGLFNFIGESAMSFNYGGKLTSSIELEGTVADMSVPVGAVYLYVVNPRNVNIKTWKLTKLKVKKKTRVFPYAKIESSFSYTSGTKSSVKEIELVAEKISEDIYALKPSTVLDKGEYALFKLEAGVPAEVYDFKVDPTLSPSLNVPSNDDVLASIGSIVGGSGSFSELAHVPVSGTTPKAMPKPVVTANSDVDNNIPQTSKVNENTFAIIIANENYQNETDVQFAVNDGNTFKKYCIQTLGIPTENVHLKENASLNNIIAEVDWLQKVCAAFNGDAKIIFYYAGHGIPDESSKDAYLLPVDGVGSNPSTGYKLSQLYSVFGKLNAQNISVFLDACFSGALRGEGMLASARGVAIKSKAATPMGKMIVFSAAQGDETAYPIKDKGHGLFTYYLLKKLQDSKGECTYNELGTYIKEQVSRRSIIVNNKSQTPSVSASQAIANTWKNMKLK
ncbi:MAG: caspase family protein [Prevotella sp.]|nr:caspase family protein [Prevotella sp.]